MFADNLPLPLVLINLLGVAPPVVALKAIDAVAIEVELQFRVKSPAERTPARNEVIARVHGQCRQDGLSLALPSQAYLYAPPAENRHRTPFSRRALAPSRTYAS